MGRFRFRYTRDNRNEFKGGNGEKQRDYTVVLMALFTAIAMIMLTYLFIRH